MTGLSGSLKVISFPALVRFLADLRRTGCLRLTQGRWTGEVYFDRGQVVAAAFGAEQGPPALAASLLALGQGQFTFAEGAPPPARNVELAGDALQAYLEEAATAHGGAAAAIPSLAAVPRIVETAWPATRGGAAADAEGTAGAVVLDRGTLQTLLAVNGRRTVEDLAAQRGFVRTVDALAELIQLGLIRIEAPAEAPAEAPGAPAAPAPPAGPPQPPVPAYVDQSREGGSVYAPARPVETLTLPAGSAAAAPPQSASPRAPTGTCPKLGFVDDPTNRYSRPTQLHRCFALASPERISTQDQRDLCLSDRFPSCPRFIAAGAADAPATLAPLAAPVSPQLDRADAAATLAPSPGPAPAMETRNGRDRLPQRAHRPLVDVAPPAASALAARPGVVAEQGAGSALVAPSEEALESAAPAHPSTEAPPTSRRGRPKAHPSAAPRVKLWRAAAGASVQRVAREPVWIVLVTLVLTLGVLTLVFSRAADQSPVADTPEAPASLPATAAGTAAPSAGGPPAQTPPPAAGATAAPGTAGPLRTVLDEPFANNQRNWPHNPQSTAWLAEGGYRLLARQPGHFVAIGAPLAEAYRNVIVTATFHKVGGPPGGGYGLIVGDQGPGPRDGVNQTGRFYVLEAGDRGEVGIWRRDGDRWVDLVPWTPSEAVRPGGATNELTAQAIGQRLTFLVNGVEVASKVDAALAEGAVGVFVGGDLNDVLLDRFAVQVVQVPN